VLILFIREGVGLESRRAPKVLFGAFKQNYSFFHVQRCQEKYATHGWNVPTANTAKTNQKLQPKQATTPQTANHKC
jgi:hypothetical protein